MTQNADSGRLRECICGETIRRIGLPEDVAKACGVNVIWVHARTLDTTCYPDDDPDCHATPIDSSGVPDAS